MILYSIRRFSRTHTVLWAGLCGGIAGVLVDLDHPYATFYKIYFQPAMEESRILHPLVFIVTSLFVCYLVACFGRLYYKHFLEKSSKEQ